MKEPLVSAIMITGKTPGHEKLARIAVHSFLQQTYQHRELIVVNDGPYELKIGHPQVKEIRVKSEDPDVPLALWELRNAGLAKTTGQWIMQWDDDDYHHPHRILYQMAHRREGCAILLRKQMRVDIDQGTVLCVDNPEGIPGTVLHPASGAKYGHKRDIDFLSQFSPSAVIPIDNGSDVWPGPALHLRLFHGENVHDRAYMMGGKGSFTKKWNPNQDEKEYISYLMVTHYGVEIAW